MTRGAEATAAEQAQWATAYGQPVSGHAAQQPAWRGWLRFWWVPLLGVVLLVGYLQSARRDEGGSLSSAGSVSVQDLREGDCFNAGDETEISEVDGVPCTEPHAYEVFASGESGGEDDAFPSDAEMDAVFASICEPAFATYVGQEFAASELNASMITPSEETWEDGDREFICIASDPSDETLTESLAGAGR